MKENVATKKFKYFDEKKFKNSYGVSESNLVLRAGHQSEKKFLAGPTLKNSVSEIAKCHSPPSFSLCIN